MCIIFGASVYLSPDHVIVSRDARSVVATEQSTWDKWRHQWQELRENNPISNGEPLSLVLRYLWLC